MSIKKILYFTSLVIAAVIVQTTSASAQVIGGVNHVVFESGAWQVKGWACLKASVNPAEINIFVGETQYGGTILTNSYAEPAVGTACGVTGKKARFSFPYTGVLKGQTITVKARGYSISNGSKVYSAWTTISKAGSVKLPASAYHPEAVIASSKRILLFVAHRDDEIVFAPMLARHCSTKICKVIVATTDIDNRTPEFINSMAKFPAQYELGGFSSTRDYRTVTQVKSAWANEASAALGLTPAQAVIEEIKEFFPDVILTFDPRHGTSCHSEHRAIGQFVYDAVKILTASTTGPFPLSKRDNFFMLTTRRYDGKNEFLKPYLGLLPAAPTDNKSPIYSAWDYIPSKAKTGWKFTQDLLLTYSSQFTYEQAMSLNNTPNLEATTAFQKYSDYNPTDSKYTVSSDSRIQSCPAP
ncbi:MAG: hypothetical protein U1E10_19550 [Bdellovibrionales bacterium]|nr:hypothetical protein [Bdellovibrionales bacterium]